MRKIVALGIALGLIVAAGSITQVRAECAGHKSQAALDKDKPSKEVAAVDKAISGSLQTAQSDKQSKPVPQVKN